MCIHDLPNDGQAKAGALGLRREERVKYFVRDVGRDARTGRR